MSTIADDQRPPEQASRARTRASAVRSAWPLLLLATLALALGWRVARDDPPHDRAAPSVSTEARTFGAARLEVPRTWVTLDRGPEHVTWGTADRTHTVTLASTEASELPLHGVVAALVDETARELPGAEPLAAPRSIELDRAPRGDTAMLARFRVDAGAAPLELAQVWRRDSRAGLDLVATWTSADGTWPVSPRSQVPRAAASG